jgi:hypothetical protein
LSRGDKLRFPSPKSFAPDRRRHEAEDSDGGEKFPRIAGRKFPASLRSISAVSAWRLDAKEITEINLGDGLQDCGCGGVAQTVWQGVIPGRIFGLQGDQRCNGVVPALQAGAPIGWPPITNNRRWLVGLTARAIAGLAFGSVPLQVCDLWAWTFLRYVTQCNGLDGRSSRSRGALRRAGRVHGRPAPGVTTGFTFGRRCPLVWRSLAADPDLSVCARGRRGAGSYRR